MGMLNQIRNNVSYGKISKEVMIKLIEKRGKRKDKKEIKNAEKIAENIEKGKEEELKPYFRLHPPRGGLKNSRMHYPKGVIGENKEIIKLIEKML